MPDDSIRIMLDYIINPAACSKEAEGEENENELLAAYGERRIKRQIRS